MGTKIVKKKRRSLVKIITSCVPNFLWKYLMPTSMRMYSNINFFDKIPPIGQNILDDSNSSFCNFRSFLYNDHLKPPHLHSTPKRIEEKENTKIKALQKELEEIKKQVAKLMEQQSQSRIISSSKYNSSGYNTINNPQSSMQVVPAPPPPPPPPPMPTQLLSGINTPLKIDTKKKALVPQKGFPCGEELLKDLKKVQLKKIEKSPGGGPIRRQKKIMNDPGDFLEAVLKRRFGLLQSSSESSHESGSLDNHSFGTGNKCETQKTLISPVS